MKVRISTISPNGLAVKDSLPLDALNTRMNEGRKNDIEFTEAPRVDLIVHKTGGGAEVKGVVSTKYRQPCSYCLEQIDQPLELPLNFFLAPKPAVEELESDSASEQFQDDVGIYYYEGDHIDLEDPIQEILILQLSRYWHPPVDEAGCCMRCERPVRTGESAEKSPTINLGDLLKKAQHSN